MPSYEASANNLMYQFFPGELFTQGKETVDVAGLHSAIVIPANFYAEPEWQRMRADACFPTHAVELRASPRLYLNNDDILSETPEFSTDNRTVYHAPKTWLVSTVFDLIQTPSAPAGRTTKNTDPRPLGILAGISRVVGT